jgi:hypothetical protein
VPGLEEWREPWQSRRALNGGEKPAFVGVLGCSRDKMAAGAGHGYSSWWLSDVSLWKSSKETLDGSRNKTKLRTGCFPYRVPELQPARFSKIQGAKHGTRDPCGSVASVDDVQSTTRSKSSRTAESFGKVISCRLAGRSPGCISPGNGCSDQSSFSRPSWSLLVPNGAAVGNSNPWYVL